MARISRRGFLGLGAAGFLGAGISLADNDANETFTFAAINDSHIKDEPSTEILDRAVAHINADKRIQWTVVLGDVGTDGTPLEMDLTKRSLQRLKRSWHVVPGNHDVAIRDEDIYGNYTRALGPVHWVHEENGWALIGFNSCEGVKSDVTVSEQELAWLKEQVDGLDPKRPLALFCHHPLNPNTRAYRVKNAEDILDLCAGRNLRLVAAGHWHGNQIEERDGVLFTTSACCADTRGNFDDTTEKGYRLYHLRGAVVETEFVEIAS